MKVTRFSTRMFTELPPVLSHYTEGLRAQHYRSRPDRGELVLCDRPGVFQDLEALAVERRQQAALLGAERSRALAYRAGFELGRREARRHLATFGQNPRLALQAGPTFGQLQGRFIAEDIRFEGDLEEGTLERVTTLNNSAEAQAHKLIGHTEQAGVCWLAAGYFAGHASEVLGTRVLTLEAQCAAAGADSCRFVSRLEAQWGEEADWARRALDLSDPGSFAPAPAIDEQVEAVTEKAQTVPVAPQGPIAGFAAGGGPMDKVLMRAKQASKTDAPMLLVGERGTGRRTLAQAIHAESGRAEGPFVLIDTAGIDPKSVEREVFGDRDEGGSGHPGLLALAEGGVLYIDEVTALSVWAQRRLLDVIRPANPGEDARVRVIASTTGNPLEAVADGALRDDVYYALGVGRVDLPPLRERGMGVVAVAERLVREIGPRYEKPEARLTEGFREALLACAWPGNVTQLRHAIEHAVVFGPNGPLSASSLPDEILVTRPASQQGAQELSADAIRAALRRTNDNRSKAAELLGIGRTTLWRAMKRHGLDREAS